MIASQIGVRVDVHEDPAYGWHPTVFASPAQAYECQLLAEEVAADLRTKFDLKPA
jgi:hypothetical protein